MGLSIRMLCRTLRHLRLSRIGIVGLSCAILVLGGPALAAGPVETFCQTIAEGLRVLNDPQGRSAERKPVQQERLWAVLAEGFDFTEFSKRVLAEGMRIGPPGAADRVCGCLLEVPGELLPGATPGPLRQRDRDLPGSDDAGRSAGRRESRGGLEEPADSGGGAHAQTVRTLEGL